MLWKSNEIRSRTTYTVHAIIAFIAALIAASPVYLEGVDDDGYAVFTKEGNYVCSIEDTTPIITQGTWDKYTKGRQYISFANAQLDEVVRYQCVPIPVDDKTPEVICFVTFRGIETRTNWINRLETMVKNNLNGEKPVCQIVKMVIMNSPAFSAIKNASDTAARQNRELTILEKSNVYEKMASIDAELFTRYGIRIVDISRK